MYSDSVVINVLLACVDLPQRLRGDETEVDIHAVHLSIVFLSNSVFAIVTLLLR